MEMKSIQSTEHAEIQCEAVVSAAAGEQKKSSSGKKNRDRQPSPIPGDLPFDVCRPAFNRESMLFLCGTTAGTSNWTIFTGILSRMTLTDTVDTSSGRGVELKAGQANCSLSQLEREWGISRKMLRKTFDRMETLGLIRRDRSREASIVSFTCIWACEQLQPVFRRSTNPLFRTPTVPKREMPSGKPIEASENRSMTVGDISTVKSTDDEKQTL